MVAWIVARSPCSVPSIFMLKNEFSTRSAANCGAADGKFSIASIPTLIPERTLVNLPRIESIGAGLPTSLAQAFSAVSQTV